MGVSLQLLSPEMNHLNSDTEDESSWMCSTKKNKRYMIPILIFLGLQEQHLKITISKDIAHNENMDHNKFLSLVICNGLVQICILWLVDTVLGWKSHSFLTKLVYLVNGFWLVCMLFCDTENDKLASFYFIILGYGASQAMWKYIFLGCFCGLDRSGMRYLYIYPVCRVFGWIFGLLLDIGLQEYKIKNVIMPIIFATIMIPHIKFL